MAEACPPPLLLPGPARDRLVVVVVVVRGEWEEGDVHMTPPTTTTAAATEFIWSGKWGGEGKGKHHQLQRM